MIGLQARRRVVYRLYREDEFLHGADVESVEPATAELPVGDDRAPRDSRTPGAGAPRPRLRRLAGSAMLLAAVGLFAVVLLKNGPRLARGGRDRPSRESSTAAFAAGSTRPAARKPSSLGLNGAARGRPRTETRRGGKRARGLFAVAHPWGGRPRLEGDRGTTRRNPSPAQQRPSVSAEPAGEAPARSGAVALEPATRLSAAPGSVAEQSSAQSPSGSVDVESPNAGSHTAAPASTVAAAEAAPQPSPRAMEFEFER
jgi:hypothetical protein